MSELINLYEIAKNTGIKVQNCLYLAQEANAVKMKPGDANIFIDANIFKNHLDTIVDKHMGRV